MEDEMPLALDVPVESPPSPLSSAVAEAPHSSDRHSDSHSSSSHSDWASDTGVTDLASEDDLEAISSYDMFTSQDWGHAAGPRLGAGISRTRSEESFSSLGSHSNTEESVCEKCDDSIGLSFPRPSSVEDAESGDGRGRASSVAGTDNSGDTGYSLLLDAQDPTESFNKGKESTVEEGQTPLSSRLVERDESTAQAARDVRDIPNWLQSTGMASGSAKAQLQTAESSFRAASTYEENDLRRRASTRSPSTPPPLLSGTSTHFSTPELLSPGEKTPFNAPDITRPSSVRPAPFGYDEKEAALESARSLQAKLEELSLASTGKRSSLLSKRLVLLLGAAVALAAASSMGETSITGFIFARQDLEVATPSASVLPSAPVYVSTNFPTGSISVAISSSTLGRSADVNSPSMAPPRHCPEACALSLVDSRTSLSVFRPHVEQQKRQSNLRVHPNASSSLREDDSSHLPDASSSAHRCKGKHRKTPSRCGASCAARERRREMKSHKRNVGGPIRRRKLAMPKKCFHRMPHPGSSQTHPHLRQDFSNAFSAFSDLARTHLDKAERGARRVVNRAEKLSARLQTDGSRKVREIFEGSHELVDFQQAQKWADDVRDSLRRRTTPVAHTIRRAAKGYGHLRRGEFGIEFTTRNSRVRSGLFDEEMTCSGRRRK
ncbi:hypothetical protein P7C70_g3031, partial [Phenoliferia sp. Uapishka_3]